MSAWTAFVAGLWTAWLLVAAMAAVIVTVLR
jgi:hypothetical protein